MVLLLTSLVALLISVRVVLAGRVSGKLNVHLVCHTHDDAGWLKVIIVQREYSRLLDNHNCGINSMLTATAVVARSIRLGASDSW